MPLARGQMSRDLLCVEPELPLTEVAKRMVAKDVGAVLVTEGKRLVGILTERDVLRAVARGIDASTTVADWMTRDPETLDPDESTEHAAVLMIHGGFRHLPVTDGDDVVGMLSIRDLMRVVLEDAVPRGAQRVPCFAVINLHGPAWNSTRPLREDPWTPMRMLGVERVEPWEILLGELPTPSG